MSKESDMAEKMSRLFHWLGHFVFNMDCGVRTDNAGRWFCKRCGRDVTDRWV